MEDQRQIVPVTESSCKKITPIFLTVLLGGGRIISNIALVNQGMQQTFLYVGFKAFPFPEMLSGLAAFSNATSDSLTRLPAIHRNLTSVNKDSDDTVQEPEYYSSGLTGIYCFIVTAGVMDMVYFTLNNFSAIIQLECQYLGDEHCKDGFDWLHILPYLPAAVICALSTGYTFAVYTLPSVKRNAINFIDYLDQFSENFEKESKWILAGTSLLALMYSVSLGATLFFSTSKMLFNLLGSTLSEYNIFQAQVYISMMTSIIGGIFSWIAEGKKLLQCQKASFSQWFALEYNEVSLRKVLAAMLFPTLAINVASHALNNFPGNMEILDKIFTGYKELKIGFSIANSLNTAFLYFAFNTGQAISNAAGVENDSFCDLYQISSQTENLNKYKNNYIFFKDKEELYYINSNNILKPIEINNIEALKKYISSEKTHLFNPEFKELIKSHGDNKDNDTKAKGPPAKLLAFHGIFKTCSQSKIDTLEININEEDSLMKSKNEKRCSCTIF